MSREGDRLTVPTYSGELRIERTPQGVRLQAAQGGSMDIGLGQARQLSQALSAICQGGQQAQGGGFGQQQQQGQQQRSFGQQSGFGSSSS